MRKPSKQPPLSQIIGRIRKSPKDAAYAVNWVKHFADKNLLKQVIDHLADSPHVKLIVGDKPFPRDYSEIHSRFPRLKCSRDPLKELHWNLGVLQKFAPKLKQYVSLRNEFGKSFLLGDFDSAESLLDDVESKISKSLWSLDKRFLLLQYRKGFAGNKEFLGNLHNACHNQFLNLFALFFSIRVERSIDLMSFYHLVETKLGEIGKYVGAETTEYFRSMLLPGAQTDPEYASHILFRSNDASLIDRLNATARFLRELSLKSDGAARLDPYREMIHRLAIATNEPSICCVAWNLNASVESTLPNDYSDFLLGLDHYTAGRYEDSIPILRAFIQKHPAAIAPYIVCAKAHAHLKQDADPIGETLSISSQILDSLTTIMIGKEGSRERILNLLSIVVDLGENHLSFGLAAYVFDLAGKPETYLSRLTELSSKFPNPMEESDATEGVARLEKLSELYPQSRTLQFLACRSRRELSNQGRSLQVCPTRLEFYTAEEQLLLGNHLIGIETLERLYSNAAQRNETPFVVLRQFAARLFNEYVNHNQLIEASQLAIRSYLHSEMLAESLDLSSLLNAINRTSIYGGNGSIYIPIVTFLSNASHYDVYRSLDGFLRSHSCRTMSDILNLATHFQIGEFSILIGEVMSEDVMAFGWRYTKDLEDLECQRIELCASLASSGQRKSKRFAEEAKAITKRQSVRRALQHVSARKLRVDSTRIKKLFKESLEPVFNRRLLFLNAERTGKLVQIGTDQLIRAAIETEENEIQEGDERPTKNPELSQESTNLLHLLLDHCYALFLWSADCSLNFLLSAEVRHGFLKNHLRKPFQIHNVILSKGNPDGEYRSSDYWLKLIEGNVSSETLSLIENRFREFSTAVDDLILHLNTKVVQIRISAVERVRLEEIGIGDRLKGTDVGYFDYTSFFGTMLSRRSILDSTDTFDAFSEICFNELLSLTERNLTRVSSYFRNEVPKTIREACDRFVEDMRAHIDKPYLWTTFLTAVQESRDGAISEANEIASWFQPAQELEPKDTNLGEIADIVATLIRSCHPKALDACSIVFGPGGEEVAVAGDAFSAVFDSLYILLQNVAEHAKLPPEEVECEIRIGTEGKRPVIEVLSNVPSEEIAIRNVELARNSLIGNGSSAAEGEGKSGLRKINRILHNAVGEQAPPLRISSNLRRFSVKLALPSGCTRQ